MEKEILGIDCNALITHNTLQIAVDCLRIDLKSFAVKVYKYFHIYTVCIEELKDFCDFVQLDHQKLLQHVSHVSSLLVQLLHKFCTCLMVCVHTKKNGQSF